MRVSSSAAARAHATAERVWSVLSEHGLETFGGPAEPRFGEFGSLVNGAVAERWSLVRVESEENRV